MSHEKRVREIALNATAIINIVTSDSLKSDVHDYGDYAVFSANRLLLQYPTISDLEAIGAVVHASVKMHRGNGFVTMMPEVWVGAYKGLFEATDEMLKSD